MSPISTFYPHKHRPHEDALGEESVIKDDVLHSNPALSDGIITIAGNADGSTHAM